MAAPLRGTQFKPESTPWRLLPPPAPSSYRCPRPSRRQSSSEAFHRHPSVAFRAAGLSPRPALPAELRPARSTADMRRPLSLPQRTAWLLKDDGETLRMRIGDGWGEAIYKTMVLAVEEDAMALIPA